MTFASLPVGAWADTHIAIAANGPSLREIPREAADHWIAVNDTFRLFPFAEVIYAADSTWWRDNVKAVVAACPEARRMCGDPIGQLPPGIDRIRLSDNANKTMPDKPGDAIIAGGFSGYQSAQIAWTAGAARISLYGFDCKTIELNARWFGGYDAREVEKMSHVGPMWEKRLTELIGELQRRGVAVDRILPASPDRSRDIGARASG